MPVDLSTLPFKGKPRWSRLRKRWDLWLSPSGLPRQTWWHFRKHYSCPACRFSYSAMGLKPAGDVWGEIFFPHLARLTEGQSVAPEPLCSNWGVWVEQQSPPPPCHKLGASQQHGTLVQLQGVVHPILEFLTFILHTSLPVVVFFFYNTCKYKCVCARSRLSSANSSLSHRENIYCSLFEGRDFFFCLLRICELC